MKFEECLAYLNDERWKQCSVEQKIEILSGIEREIAIRERRLPCALKPYRELTQKDGSISLGQYNRITKDISINIVQLERGSKYGDDYRVHLDTILHEGRHAYQDQAVLGYVDEKNIELLQQWRENMEPGHYISPKQNYLRYYMQPVEADAREYALRLSQQIEMEKIQRDKTEKSHIVTDYMKRNQQDNRPDSTVKTMEQLRGQYSQRQKDLKTPEKQNEKAAKTLEKKEHKMGMSS